MRTKKLILISSIVLLLLLPFVLIQNKAVDFILNVFFSGKTVNTPAELNQIMSQFQVVGFHELPEKFLHASGMDRPKYRNACSGMKFYVLSRKDTYQKIAGDFRIHQFISYNFYSRSFNPFKKYTIYWGIDKRILLELLKLRNLMEENGLNPRHIGIASGYRTPSENDFVGGATMSRHIFGDAVDIRIGDVNNDGKFTKRDKDQIIDICEKLINGRGGMGLYPGTRILHIDLRGHRARWNSYSRKK